MQRTRTRSVLNVCLALLAMLIALSGAVALFVGLQVGSTAQGRPMFERGTIVTLVGALVFQCAVALFVRWRARRSGARHFLLLLLLAHFLGLHGS